MGQTCAVDARADVARSFLAALFDAACVSRIVFSSKHLGLYLESPVIAVCGGVFPAVGVNLHRHQVTLDGVLVAEQGSANFPGASRSSP